MQEETKTQSSIVEDSKAPVRVVEEAPVKDEAVREPGIKPILKTTKSAGKPGMLSKSKGGGLFGGGGSSSQASKLKQPSVRFKESEEKAKDPP